MFWSSNSRICISTERWRAVEPLFGHNAMKRRKIKIWLWKTINNAYKKIPPASKPSTDWLTANSYRVWKNRNYWLPWISLLKIFGLRKYTQPKSRIFNKISSTQSWSMNNQGNRLSLSRSFRKITLISSASKLKLIIKIIKFLLLMSYVWRQSGKILSVLRYYPFTWLVCLTWV